MKTFNLINALNEAYGASTKSNNLFAKLINSIKWDDEFTEDGEMYFIKNDLTLTVENLDPFEENWKPSVMVGTYMRDLGWI